MTTLALLISAAFRRWSFWTAALILVAGGIVKWQINLMPEHLDRPQQVMPSPNARDYFTAAERVMTKGFESPVELSGHPPLGPIDTYQDTTRNTMMLASAEKEVSENSAAIALFRKGLAYPYLAPPPQFNSSGYDLSGVYEDTPLARLIAIQGECNAARGDWEGAMTCYLSGMKFGSDLPKGAENMCWATDSCETIARGPAYVAVAHLSASQARAAAQSLFEIDSAQVPLAQVLEEEKAWQQAHLLAQFNEPRWRMVGLIPISAAEPRDRVYPLENLSLILESPRTACDNNSRYMDEIVHIASLPWPQAKEAKWPAQPTDPLNKINGYLPNRYFHYTSTVSIALNRLLDTQLALRAYRLDNGRYPASLSGLIPTYLPAVPEDPFSDNASLKYRLQGSSYLLYSVGPDAVDNGGVPLRAPNIFCFNYNGAKGDIVAGVNY